MKTTLLAAGFAAGLLLIVFLLLGESPPAEQSTADSQGPSVQEFTAEDAANPLRDRPRVVIGEPSGDLDSAPPAEVNEPSATSFSELPPTPARRERLEELGGGMTLGPRVIAIVTEIQTRQVEEQWEEATNELNALYEEWDLLNTLEKTTLLNFYTNNFLAQRMYPEAIATFSRMLTIPDLRPDIASRALKSLGQLYLATGQPELAVPQFEEWIEYSDELDLQEGERERVEEFLLTSQSLIEEQGETNL